MGSTSDAMRKIEKMCDICRECAERVIKHLDVGEQKGTAPLKGLRHVDFSAGLQQLRGGVQCLDWVGHQRD